MRREIAIYLRDAWSSGHLIPSYTSGFDLEKYKSDRAIQGVVERRFEIIGEALNRCKRHYPDELRRLGEIQPIIDFRNHLAHRYDAIDSEVVWGIVVEDLPGFMVKVNSLLGELEGGAV